MKKILYVEFSSGFGGSSEALYSLIKHLDRAQYEPVLLIRQPGINFDRITAMGIKTIRMDSPRLEHFSREGRLYSHLKGLINLGRDFGDAGKILKIIRQEKIDLVHNNTIIKNNLHCMLATKWAGIPCISHVRETRVLLKLEKQYRRLLDRILVLNKESQVRLSEGYDPKKVILVPDGLDPCVKVDPQDLENIRKQFGLHNHLCVGVLGRLVEGKGQDDFIQAAAMVLKQRKDIKFLVIGNDPDKNYAYEQKLRAQVKELHIEDNLVFTGWRKDKYEMISVLDIVVQASSTYPEGTPLICLEAMYLGKPVVATDIPGSNAMVADGVTGFLVPRADPAALAGAILKILQDPLLARQMGEAGQRRVEEQFHIRNVVEKIENAYADVFLEKGN